MPDRTSGHAGREELAAIFFGTDPCRTSQGWGGDRGSRGWLKTYKCRVPDRQAIDEWIVSGSWEGVSSIPPIEIAEEAPTSVADAIRVSRAILDMPLDPEDEDSPRLDKATWERATAFLSRHARAIWDLRGRVVSVPHIAPVPDGSIDLHWKGEDYELLVNIPSEEGAKGQYYGEEAGENHFKGTLNINTVHHLLVIWLATR